MTTPDEFETMGFIANDKSDEFSAIGVRTVSSDAVWLVKRLHSSLPTYQLLDLLTRSDHESK